RVVAGLEQVLRHEHLPRIEDRRDDGWSRAEQPSPGVREYSSTVRAGRGDWESGPGTWGPGSPGPQDPKTPRPQDLATSDLRGLRWNPPGHERPGLGQYLGG